MSNLWTAARTPAETQPGRPPLVVPLLNPLVRRLLAVGMPMGVNALVTVPGRTTGRPRTTPLAIIEVEGRRWVWSPWGDTGWVRNLRASGRATITVRRRGEDVVVTELDLAHRIWFFRDVLRPYAHRMRFGVILVRIVDGVDVDRAEAMAEGRRVFELHPLR